MARIKASNNEKMYLDIRVGRCYPGWTMDWTSNDQLMIIYCLTGQGNVCMGKKVSCFERGNIIIISPNTLHKLELIDDAGFVVIMLFLNRDVDELFNSQELKDVLSTVNLEKASAIVTLEDEQKKWLDIICKQLFLELSNKDSYSFDCLINLVELVIIEINRSFRYKEISESPKDMEPSEFSQVIKDIIQYIDNNYMEDIGLNTIAKSFWLNPSYLSRQFKKSLGVTITEYILSRRVFYAKQLLATSKLNVSEVALRVGFANISYFGLVFKNSVGMTPKQFQKESKGDADPENT